MRPTTSTMLQQNNNNNYPCLNVSGSTREMLQKCSRGSLPFPSRLELGLGDLPLVRGLRAWALCSKNRRKTGSPLGGGQAPAAPPASRGNSTSCPRPADVYPTGEWGRMGYGLPLGLDARQAGIGALVTVATLKTSEGGGKTQTQCLFLRTEKGSCLYSTAKPGACSLGMGLGMTPTAASTLVGGWLRGKAAGGGGGGGGGGRDSAAGRRDHGPTPPAQTGANRVRVRSGRRWRKSGNAAGPGQDRTGLSREKQLRSREEAAGEIILEERQEERDKEGFPTHGPGGKQPPSPQQDGRRGRQEKGGTNRSPRCCHSASAKTCTRCGRRAERREGQEGQEGGEGPRGGASALNRLNDEVEGMRKEKQEKAADEEEEEEARGGLIGLESSNSILAVPNPDLESNCFYPESHSGCEAGETRDEESRETQEALRTQTSRSKDGYSEREEDTNPQTEVMKTHTGNSDIINGRSGRAVVTDDFTLRHNGDSDDRKRETATSTCVAAKPNQKPSEGIAADVNGFSAHMVPDEESERESESLSGGEEEEEEGSESRTPAPFPVASDCYEEACVSLSSFPSSTAASFSPSKTPEPSTPLEGSTSTGEHETDGGRGEQESSNKDGEHDSNKQRCQLEEGDTAIVVKEELDDSRCELQEPNSVAVDKKDLCRNNTVKEELNEPVCELYPEDTQSASEEDRNPCKQPREALFSKEEEEKERQLEEGNTSPLLRQVDGRRDASTFETDREVLVDTKRGEEDECSGTELNEATGAERRDELAGENGREESEQENLTEGERVRPKEANETEATRRKEGTGEELQDGGVKGGDEKERNAEEKLDGWGDESGRQELDGKDIGEEVKRNCPVKGEWGAQESAEGWGTGRKCVSHLSVPLVEEAGVEGEWKEVEVEDGETCKQVPATANNANVSHVEENGETRRSLSPIPASTTAANVASADPSTSHALSPANPAPRQPPLGAMATGLPCLEVGGAGVATAAGEREGKTREGRELESPAEEQGEEERGSTVAAELGEKERGRTEEEEEEGEEDEFGVFMQAEGEPAWSEGFAMSASVPCGSRESAALGNHAVAGESTHWTSGWTDSSFHQSEDTWAAFPQDSPDEGRDAVGQWWPISAVEERRDRLSANQNLTSVFSEAFPSLPGSPSCDPGDPCDPDTVPTLTQLLRGKQNHNRANQDQGLLDNFHDLNKMIGQRYKRANGVSRDLLLKTLQLDRSLTESRTGPWTANRRLSPGLPSANQHAQNAAAKRRLSYDYNRNIME